MRKIELEHLSIYLPYDLLLFKKGLRPDSILFTDKDTVTVMSFVSMMSCIKWNYFTPMLLPMDSLTKTTLREAGFTTHIDFLTEEYQQGNSILSKADRIKKAPFGMIMFLVKNHYDIFELIPQGLAIDKRTINITPTDEI